MVGRLQLFNNLRRFYSGGVFELFKEKQAEWGAPRVNIFADDVPQIFDIEQLDDVITIYRGLSKAEHESKNYAQSWTIDLSIARNFAQNVYSDELKGVVVKTTISREQVIYYD